MLIFVHRGYMNDNSLTSEPYNPFYYDASLGNEAHRPNT